MADTYVMIRNGGSVRIVSDRKFSKWFKAKGYEKVPQSEIDAYNKEANKKASKKADA